MGKSKETRKRRKIGRPRPQTPPSTVSTKKSRWLDPVNLGLGIASLVVAAAGLILGLRAGPTVSLDSPLDPNDVLTTPIEIANNGLLDLKDVRVVTFIIVIEYGPVPGVPPDDTCPDRADSCVLDSVASRYVPPNRILRVDESETVPFGSVMDAGSPAVLADIALIAFYEPAYMPFWHKRKAFRFVTARQADGKVIFQKQPVGDALERLDRKNIDFTKD